MKWFICIYFLHNEFYVKVSQIITNLILHTILDVYPRITVMNTGLLVVKNIMCNVNHQKPFGLGLTDVNEVHKRILFIIYDKIVFLYWNLYHILCLVALWCRLQMPNQSLAMLPPCFWHLLYINIYTHNKLITSRYFLFLKLHHKLSITIEIILTITIHHKNYIIAILVTFLWKYWLCKQGVYRDLIGRQKQKFSFIFFQVPKLL